MARTSRIIAPPMIGVARMSGRTIKDLGSLAAPALAAALAALILAPAAFALAALVRPGAAPAGAAEMALTTAGLCLAAAGFALAFGLSCALVVGAFEFPGRRILSWALAAPLAAPGYVAVYAWADALSPFGPIANFLGWTGAPPVSIRTFWGAAFALGATAYPYVYLAARAALARRSAAMMEAALTLGADPARALAFIVAPGLRPALAGGLALVMMEAAADFGVAEYCGLKTLSVGIFRTWYGLGDLAGAARLAGVLFLFACAFALLEERARRGRAADGARALRPPRRIALSPVAGALAALWCMTPIALGLGVPVATLAGHAAFADFAPLLRPALNSVSIAAPAAALIVAIAGALVLSARFARARAAQLAIRAATLGYAVPGAVIAMGVLSIAAQAMGVAALVYAYVARFTTAGFNAVAGGAATIPTALDEAARALGASPLRIAREIHAPLLARAGAAAFIIVFVDIVKELPATLILRSFNFETLATAVYRLASDERFSEASPAALALIAAGLAPVILLERIAR